MSAAKEPLGWDEGWAESMRVNVVEPAGLAREAVKHGVERGGGTIITISSWAAQAGSALPQVPAYAASKAAIRNLTQTIARNFAKDGVLAYVVAPGIVRTSMSEISAEARGGIDKVHAALAMGEPSDEIIKLSKERKVDLIAMSTHGHRFISDLLYGSTVDRVRHLVDIPVLLLKAAK